MGQVPAEPFGGLASAAVAAVAAVQAQRFPCAAEKDQDFAEIAAQRLQEAVTQYAFTR
jgi:hypothetical protein